MNNELDTVYYRVPLYDDYTGLVRTSLVTQPAIENDFELFNKVDVKEEHFELNEEERIIYGPVMIPDKKIIRKFSDGSGYYNCVFSKEDIENTVKKASKLGRFNQFNLQHSQLPEDMVEGVYLIESIILSDRTKSERFKNLPDGSWIIGLWVESEDYWNNVIKSGDFKGFSVEIRVSMEAEDFIKQDMLNRIEQTLYDEKLNNEQKKKLIEKIIPNK